MSTRQTRTVAELEVSPQVYDEVKRLLSDAGYRHAFITQLPPAEPLINMNGIALSRGEVKMALNSPTESGG